MRSNLLTIPSRPGPKWIVLLIWFVAMGVIFGADLPTKFDDAQSNESTSFLPSDAESTRALAAAKEIQGGEQVPLVIVYRRSGGLTAEDQARIESDRSALNADPLRTDGDQEAKRPSFISRYSKPVPSPDGTAAVVQALIRTNGNSDRITEPVDAAREQIGSSSEPGVEAAVTGGAGFSADAIDVFESINGTLLLATAGIVFLLLLVVYRSPIFWFFPLFAVGFAELAARGIGFGLTEIGVTVNGQSAGILPVLVFGAGTDYALLLVARYREELRRHEDKHEAMAEALRRAGPAIVASGLTVVAALLCLTIAQVQGTAGLGPIGAVGIAVAMVSMLTILPASLLIPRSVWLGILAAVVVMGLLGALGLPLPAVLVLALGAFAGVIYVLRDRTPSGGWAFWPFVPHVGDEASDETHGAWRRIGERIANGPRRVWVGVVALLLVMSLGWLNFDLGLNQGNQFRDDVESVRGQNILAEAFPAGATGPTDVIVPDKTKAKAVAGALGGVDGVDAVRKAAAGSDGVLLQATLADDPYGAAARDLVPTLRETAKQAGGQDVLIGGATAVETDLRDAASRDSKLIPPIALAVVLLILIVLLRSVAAPLLLIGTVILSFVAALGVGFVAFDVIFGFPGSDPSLPLFAFIFLVALGVDYNIFLMARVREETERVGPREGTLRGLAVTGAVITSAGIVLAGTFSTLAVLPLIFLTELGFVVAFGVLLDTFIVRSILVPALALDLGRRTWWPSALARADEPVAPAQNGAAEKSSGS